MLRTLSAAALCLVLAAPAQAQKWKDEDVKPDKDLSGAPGARYRALPARAKDRIYAQALGKTLERPATVTRRSYPTQAIPHATQGGKPVKFAARETRVALGDDLVVRRLSFPNADVARAWAGAQAGNELVPLLPRPDGARVVSLRGKDALVLEGPALTDSNTAAHALWQGWEHAPTSAKQTDLFSVDDGAGLVLQSGKNPVLGEQLATIYDMLDLVLPAGTRPTRIGHGSAQRLPSGIRSTAADGEVQELRKLPGGVVQLELGPAQGLTTARRLYDALAPKGRHRPNAPKPTLAAPRKAGATQALERATR